MNAVSRPTDRSWFRSAAGLRFSIEVGVVVLAKLAALVLLYFAFIAPQPRVDASPAAMRAHVFAAGTQSGNPGAPAP